MQGGHCYRFPLSFIKKLEGRWVGFLSSLVERGVKTTSRIAHSNQNLQNILIIFFKQGQLGSAYQPLQVTPL
jgi:hypothetical protein